jgi:hypothetical protein
MDRRSSGYRLAAVLAALGAPGCGGSESDLCAQAAAHVAECLGAQPPGPASACDAEHASAVLAQGCGELTSIASAGKADVASSLWCWLGWNGGCVDPTRNLNIRAQTLGPGGAIPVQGLRVQLLDVTGNVQRWGTTDARGMASFPALPKIVLGITFIGPSGQDPIGCQPVDWNEWWHDYTVFFDTGYLDHCAQ